MEVKQVARREDGYKRKGGDGGAKGLRNVLNRLADPIVGLGATGLYAIIYTNQHMNVEEKRISNLDSFSAPALSRSLLSLLG